MSKSIALSGMMGAGKNTVGKELADLLGRGFTDVDRELEVTVGMSVANFVADSGMDAFREAERTAIETVSRHDDMVIALGGGAVLDARNIKALHRHSVIVHLDVPTDELTRRLSGTDMATRPLLTGIAAPSELIAALAAEREPIYASTCDVSVDGTGSPEVVAGRIIEYAAAHDILTPSEVELFI